MSEARTSKMSVTYDFTLYERDANYSFLLLLIIFPAFCTGKHGLVLESEHEVLPDSIFVSLLRSLLVKTSRPPRGT